MVLTGERILDFGLGMLHKVQVLSNVQSKVTTVAQRNTVGLMNPAEKAVNKEKAIIL